MASVKSFDLYTCKVCLENMLDKNPRSLSCLHTFCTDCLRKIMKDGVILCPTCREETLVPSRNIISLKANFMLQEVKAHLDEVLSSKALFCQLCLAESAVLKCQECIQLLCEDCSLKHNKVKTFKDHKLFKLCPKHKEGMITHLCMKCVQPSCSKCVMTEHLDHEADIKLSDKGLKIIKQNINQYKGDVEDKVLVIRKYQNEATDKLMAVTKLTSQVKEIREYYLQKAKEADEVLEILNKDEEKGQERQKEYEIKMNDCLNIQETTRRLQHDDMAKLDNYKILKEETEKILQETTKEKMDFKLTEINILDPRSNKTIGASKESSLVVKNDGLIGKVTYQRSSKGPVSISECSNDGKFICLENTGRRAENLEHWEINRIIDGRSQGNFVLPRDFCMPPGRKVKIWAKGKVENPGPFDIESNCYSWGTGANITTKLINPQNEDRATYVQKTMYSS